MLMCSLVYVVINYLNWISTETGIDVMIGIGVKIWVWDIKNLGLGLDDRPLRVKSKRCEKCDLKCKTLQELYK